VPCKYTISNPNYPSHICKSVFHVCVLMPTMYIWYILWHCMHWITLHDCNNSKMIHVVTSGVNGTLQSQTMALFVTAHPWTSPSHRSNIHRIQPPKPWHCVSPAHPWTSPSDRSDIRISNPWPYSYRDLPPEFGCVWRRLAESVCEYLYCLQQSRVFPQYISDRQVISTSDIVF
jgi:hypothetical protein